MRKANATIYAAAAVLGLCLMSPYGAAAAPATPDLGKAYIQTAKGEDLIQVRHVRHHAYRHHRVYRHRYCCGWRPRYATGFGWGWPLGFGIGMAPALRIWGFGWGYPYYSGGYPYNYGGYYPRYYRSRCCYW